MNRFQTQRPKTLYIFDQGLRGLVGHYYEYVRSIVEAAADRGWQSVVGCHIEAGDCAFASFPLHPVFAGDVWATVPGEDYHSAASMTGVSTAFMRGVDTILKDYPIQAGDIVFLPNIAKPHVVAAAMVAEQLGPLGARTHFMFRYPSTHFQGETAAAAFRRLEAAARNYDVTLCTDSHRLSAELSVLSSLPFEIYPIPHTWHGEARDKVSIADRPLHCVSLGNARDEKGIVEILQAIRLTEGTSWGDQLRFTLQVNAPYKCDEAIQEFRSGPVDHRTRLIDNALSSDEYAALLDQADVVLVPYWRSIYNERSSGVFLEGLTTGKLVIGTADTWMSDLLEIHGSGVAVEDRSPEGIAEGLRHLVERRVEFEAKAKVAAEYWRKIHSPANFMAHLVGEGATPAYPAKSRTGYGRAAILFPWGEAVGGRTGAALRLKYFVEYMENVYEDIKVLFTGGGEPGGAIGKRTRAEPHHYPPVAVRLHQSLKQMCRDIGAPEEDCFHLWYHLWPEIDEVFALKCEELVMWADHIYVDYSYFVPIVDDLCREYGKSYTVTFHDIVSDQSLDTAVMNRAIRALEFDAARRAPRVVCASSEDRQALAKEGVKADLIPHPIDAQESCPPLTREESLAILEELYELPLAGKHLCFFVGSLYPPNIEAAEKIAEMAARCANDLRFADLQFVVAGGCMKPHEAGNFRALGMIEGGALSACLSLADLVLVPLLRGTGVSLKSVEALARGSLILSTSVGMRGLEVVDGVHCVIEDDVEKFPERIAEMLTDEASAAAMRTAAYQFGQQFDYRRLMPRYLEGALLQTSLDEEPASFNARRSAAIAELMPKIRASATRSPALLALLSQFDGGPAASTAALEPAAVTASRSSAISSNDAAVSAVPSEFDQEWYLAKYPDVAMLGMDPWEHYQWIGRELGRQSRGVKKKVSMSLA